MSLPLAKELLPAKVQRFGAPDAPTPAKLMAARGLVPVKGEDLVALLVQLASDPDTGVRETAHKTLEGLPETVLAAACGAPLHEELLGGLVPHVRGRPELLGDLVANRGLPVHAVAEVARWADERTCERIATDQARLLEAPEIIEGLYKNRNTRMSTVDRIVELAARNGVVLHNVATFEAHVEAIQDQLIVDEPTDEPLPADAFFAESLQLDSDEDAVERDKVDGSEEVKDKHRPLATRVADMSIAEKIRLSLVGNAAARSILVRDSNKTVAMAAIGSPAMTDAEAARVAVSKQISEDVLRYIGNRREWHGNYEVKRNLVFNAKTPMGISMKFLVHMRTNDLRALARSKGIPASLRTAAKQRMDKKKRS